MTVSISGKYLGGLRVELSHEPSGTALTTSAPKDNHGDGASFSPTDLVAAALGSCMMTVMAIVAERDSISLVGMRMSIEKHMGSAPRRIARMPLQIHLPMQLSDAHRQKLENAARTCPVHHSLHPDVVVELTFLYDVSAVDE